MNRRQFLATGSAAFLAAKGNLIAEAAPTQKRPNLLFLLCDQLRLEALSCSGNRVISTLNIDRIAREGVRFANPNCTVPVCVPSKTSMLTGLSACRTGIHDNSGAFSTSNPGSTFDNILHDHGYRTEYYGKWHAPYALASTYDNKVATTDKIPGAPSYEEEWMKFMDKLTPKRPMKKGEAFNTRYNRPYIPYPVDPFYEEAMAGKMPGVKRTPPFLFPHGYLVQNTIGMVQIPPAADLTSFTTDQTLKALDRMKDGPFSLTCSIDAPHPPFLATESYASMFPFAKMPLPLNMTATKDSPYLPEIHAIALYCNQYNIPEYLRQFISVYYAMVKEVDDNIGRILAKLDELKLTDNTLVIFTSDHGEMLGSHGMVSKFAFYNESVQVPLLMRFPGRIKPDTVVKQPVSGLDLFPTILDYMGVPLSPRDGYSLRSCIEGTGTSGPEFRVSQWYEEWAYSNPPNHIDENVPNYMVRTADWKLMMGNSPNSTSIDGLYDLKNDPMEMNNLLGTGGSKYASKADEMKQLLLSWLRHVNSPDIDGITARRFV